MPSRKSFGKNERGLKSIMNDIYLISLIWVVIGAVVVYFVDKRAYQEGLMDAVLMHYRGELTYKGYYDDAGEEMVEIEVNKGAK